jgi:uncharacterized protein HemY
MNTTQVPNVLLALLLIFASFGVFVVIFFLALCIAVWRDERKIKKATDQEYKALYDAMISHFEIGLHS